MAITAEQVIKAIDGSGGLVTTVAQRLGISRVHAHRLINKYSTAKDALEDEREKLIDLAESKLVSQINKENMTAIIFYLKTQGRRRGYVEKQQHEVTGEDGAPLKIIVGYENDKDNST